MPTRSRPGLTRDRVLRAALDLVDREGVDALTMRRLGRDLGVEAMSLYSHIASKEDLVEGVVEQVFREMPPITPGAGGWQQQVRTHARAYREVLLAHPETVRLVAGRPLVTEGTASFVDSALGLLRGIGLDVERADRVLGIVASFTLGHVSEQVGRVRRHGGAPPGRAVDRSRFSHLAELGEMTPADHDTEFELGLDWLIAGIERLLATGHERAPRMRREVGDRRGRRPVREVGEGPGPGAVSAPSTPAPGSLRGP